MNKTKAFTLAEVVLSLGITAILFLGVTRVLIASLSYSKNIIGVIRFQQEQQRLHLAITNAFAESETVVYPTPSANPVMADKIILRNKPTSILLPFTIIEPTSDNRLIVRDFTLDPSVTTPPSPSPARNDKIVGLYKLQAATNRIIIGNGDANPCSATTPTDCVVFGYKKNTLAFGATGYAPFIGAPLISDMRIDADADYIDILSPYEKREYKIRVATNGPTTAQLWSVQVSTAPGVFPYYYVGTVPTTPTLNSTTTFIPPTPPSRPYNITELIYNATNPTQAAPSSPVELRVIQFKVTDAANPNLTATVTVPAMVKK